MFLKTLWNCIFSWRVKPQGRPHRADIIIGQSFGIRSESDPGLSNRALAKVIYKIHHNTGLPMILQWELGLLLRERKLKNKLFLIQKHRIQGKYLDTGEVLAQTIELAKRELELARPRVVIVAHPQHLPRVKMQAEKLGLTVVVPEIGKIPFDPESAQWWTRELFLWLVREIPGRFYCLLKGLI